jgi:hypothetical protein
VNRTTKLTFLAAAAALAVSAVGGAARAGAPAASVVSRSWAGYVATAPAGRTLSFTSAAGEWTVPTVRCARGDRSASSAAWVGLGGYASRTPKVQQVGTDSNCDSSGAPTYSAWFEVVPYPAYSIDETVRPGDAMAGSVRILAGNVELRLSDRTRGWSFVRTISWPEPDTSSAEWVIEAPATCLRYRCFRPGLANFGAVAFHHVAAVAGGRTGTLVSRAWKATPLRLVPVAQSGTLGVEDQVGQAPPSPDDRPPISPAGASPTPAADAGASFTIAWAADERGARRR